MIEMIPRWFIWAVAGVAAITLGLIVRAHVRFEQRKNDPKDPLFAAFLVATRPHKPLKGLDK